MRWSHVVSIFSCRLPDNYTFYSSSPTPSPTSTMSSHLQFPTWYFHVAVHQALPSEPQEDNLSCLSPSPSLVFPISTNDTTICLVPQAKYLANLIHSLFLSLPTSNFIVSPVDFSFNSISQTRPVRSISPQLWPTASYHNLSHKL